ncbi:MAG: hypothetical protein MUF64_30135 [Polyangiaceae bacterium]|jgi:hypothetical protein|nr:hypothetical protein [Polyangiaceae bacterium]
MSVAGLEGMDGQQVLDEVQRGGRFVVFPYTLSIVVLTFSRHSKVHFIRAGEGTFGKAFPYLMLSLLFGWWGFPFGLIYTPISLFQSLSGGKDITREVMAQATG